MEQRPTKKQKELLSFIDGFIKGNGYSPSYREIMRALDYRSVSTVATHVNGLVARGWLVKRDNSARTLELIVPEAMADNTPVATATKTGAKHELQHKLTELKQAKDTPAEDIAVLERALVLLGYTRDSELA